LECRNWARVGRVVIFGGKFRGLVIVCEGGLWEEEGRTGMLYYVGMYVSVVCGSPSSSSCTLLPAMQCLEGLELGRDTAERERGLFSLERPHLSL
jgi:hypothetical protein